MMELSEGDSRELSVVDMSQIRVFRLNTALGEIRRRVIKYPPSKQVTRLTYLAEVCLKLK